MTHSAGADRGETTRSRGEACGVSAAAFPMRGLRATAIGLVALAVACAPTIAVRLPDPARGTRDARGFDTMAALASSCRDQVTATAEVGVSGRAAGHRVRGTLQIGLSRPDGVRIDAVAPFGAPIFVLASTGDDTTVLVLPRAQAYVKGTSVAQVLDAGEVLGAGAAHDAGDRVALGEQQFGEIAAVLSGDAGNESSACLQFLNYVSKLNRTDIYMRSPPARRKSAYASAIPLRRSRTGLQPSPKIRPLSMSLRGVPSGLDSSHSMRPS